MNSPNRLYGNVLSKRQKVRNYTTLSPDVYHFFKMMANHADGRYRALLSLFDIHRSSQTITQPMPSPPVI